MHGQVLVKVKMPRCRERAMEVSGVWTDRPKVVAFVLDDNVSALQHHVPCAMMQAAGIGWLTSNIRCTFGLRHPDALRWQTTRPKVHGSVAHCSMHCTRQQPIHTAAVHTSNMIRDKWHSNATASAGSACARAAAA